MPIETRTRSKLSGPGPFVARITNLLDPTYMGAVEVAIEKGFTTNSDVQSQTYIVQYLSPFYGVTGIQYEGNDPTAFNDVQKSYGMWMIPPDIGTKVLVVFLDGDPGQGYWIGCIADKFQNHMTPGIASSKNVHITPEQERKYGTKFLPTAEFHKKSVKEVISPDSQKKPIHPFAERLLAQGLLIDDVRGVTSSSARREVPSGVFGISTPGPLDPSGKKGLVGYDTKVSVPVSRLGGTQFVMDDGDTSGKNELVRIRTRTGHQILLHNTDDLIYIANSQGTAWIEFTSDGKIDIFAQDSVSIHTKNDFNFNADRDINIEAGRDINIKAGRAMDTNITDHYNLIVGKSGKLHFKTTVDMTVDSDYKVKVGGSFDQNTGGHNNLTAGAETNIKSGSNNNFTTGATTNIKSGGQHIETASSVHMNGPAAATATAAVQAVQPTDLPTFTLPNTSIGAGWEDYVYYKTDDLTSIMKRVPVHEPWDHHENTDPASFKPDSTDVGETPA